MTMPFPSSIRGASRQIFFIIFILLILGLLIGPITGPVRPSRQNPALQTAHVIGLCLVQYANDHGGHFPNANSSTEIFQHLIDDGYVTDPVLFYTKAWDIPGKVIPTSTKLSPANVCWDVTCSSDFSVPNNVPVIFLTGYRVTYEASSPAIPIAHEPIISWYDWLHGKSPQSRFIAAFYVSASLPVVGQVSNWAKIMLPDSNGTISNFIPADFDPKGKTYRQLTP